MLSLLIVTLIASSAIAQKTTSLAIASAVSSTSAAAGTVVPVFLPISIDQQLGASVVTANAQQTIYEAGCLSPSDCSFKNSVRLTEGRGTFACTVPTGVIKAVKNGPLTVSCNLSGGFPATAATCTLQTNVPGLGGEVSVSTLPASQINYARLTITAGDAKLRAAASESSAPASSSSSGAGCERTVAPLIVGAAAIGLMGAM